MRISPTTREVDATTDEQRGRQLHSRSTARTSDGPRATTIGAAPGRVAAAPYSRPQSRRARSIGSSRSAIGGEQLWKHAGHDPSMRDDARTISRSRSRARTKSRRRGEPSTAIARFRTPWLDQVVDFYGPLHSSCSSSVAMALLPRPWPAPLLCLPPLADPDADFSPSFSPEHLTALYVAQHGAGGSRPRDSPSRSQVRKLSYVVPEEDEAWAAAAAEAPAESPPSGNARRQGEEGPTTRSAPFSCPYEQDTRHDRARRRLAIITTHLIPQSN